MRPVWPAIQAETIRWPILFRCLPSEGTPGAEEEVNALSLLQQTQGTTPATTEGDADMKNHSTRTGTLSRAQLCRLLEILKPYQGQPFNAAVIQLAAQLARAEA